VNNPVSVRVSVRKETLALHNAAKKEPSLIGKSPFAFIAERLVILIREWTPRRSSLAPRPAVVLGPAQIVTPSKRR
jgi:hypothetical protein